MTTEYILPSCRIRGLLRPGPDLRRLPRLPRRPETASLLRSRYALGTFTAIVPELALEYVLWYELSYRMRSK